VTAANRTRAAPDIPTAAEAGYPMDVAIWHGLWAPKGTPPDIIARLNAAAIAAFQDPDIRQRMEDLGQELQGNQVVGRSSHGPELYLADP
jgi:tripartite-type tricarboxylate transporter receptor subunit TctC